MGTSSVARRYARALLSIGSEGGRFDAYAQQLTRIVEAWDASSELRTVWTNPAFGRAVRLEAVQSLATRLGLDAPVSSVISLLVERGRALEIPLVAAAFQELADAKAGRLRATVSTAAAVSSDVAAHIGQTLGTATGKTVQVSSRVDPSLIGGVVLQVGSTVFDGSVRSQLERIGHRLRGD